jgi:hypothetical protein
MVVEQASFVMHLTPCFPFLLVVVVVLLVDIIPRVVGFLVHGGGAAFNAWSLSCLLGCSCAFIANRYRAELGERRLFQLQSSVADLQARACARDVFGLVGVQCGKWMPCEIHSSGEGRGAMIYHTREGMGEGQ